MLCHLTLDAVSRMNRSCCLSRGTFSDHCLSLCFPAFPCGSTAYPGVPLVIRLAKLYRAHWEAGELHKTEDERQCVVCSTLPALFVRPCLRCLFAPTLPALFVRPDPACVVCSTLPALFVRPACPCGPTVLAESPPNVC
eukprot:SAG22_NODE_136_length_18095_cov_19.897255_30_plen_139_part_00